MITIDNVKAMQLPGIKNVSGMRLMAVGGNGGMGVTEKWWRLQRSMWRRLRTKKGRPGSVSKLGLAQGNKWDLHSSGMLCCMALLGTIDFLCSRLMTNVESPPRRPNDVGL